MSPERPPAEETESLPRRDASSAFLLPVERRRVDVRPTGKRLAVLSVTALGVVFGDIGTSPLYALKECFNPTWGVVPTPANVYGILSLIVWSLTLVVSIKYILFIMRADNDGEGGILALLALILKRLREKPTNAGAPVLVALGLFGAALLYGDGIITPAISVLGAIEGLKVAAPVFGKFVVPATVVVLFALFLFQRRGTHGIGKIFGPIMLVWFASIAVLGAAEIVREPEILYAVNPWYALEFFRHNSIHGFLLLGAVVLAVTGAEALYADMGHFGRRPIRLAWFAAVFPALLLSYFGQGALLLRDASAAENPFYRLVPTALQYPMLILATTAAAIASQALISGAFSLTQQAMQLGYSPRVTIRHTSKDEAGQIYVPEINQALMVGSIALVLGFGSSSALAAAYGIAVTGTMVITTLLFYVVAVQRWNWSATNAGLFLLIFLVIDLSFLFANAVKIQHGGWFPLVVASILYAMMTTWKRGRQELFRILRAASLSIDTFLEDVTRKKPTRVPGTAVFMTSDMSGVPVVLLHHLKHNKVLHEHVILLSITTSEVPEVSGKERVTVEPLDEGFYRVTATYGFMQTPRVREIMTACGTAGLKVRPGDTTYYLGREQLIPTGTAKLARWRKLLFMFMSRNSRSATQYFGLPPNRVVELGAQIEF